MLLPESVEDYVGPDNPVRVIGAFVEGLDLAALGFALKAEHAERAPAYDPRALLKLYVYGYLNRIRSSRELEKAARRNLEVVWRLGRLTPDHGDDQCLPAHAARALQAGVPPVPSALRQLRAFRRGAGGDRRHFFEGG